MTDPRDGRRVALKKLPNVFQSLVSSKRVFRELKMLCYFKHENVSIHDQQSHLHRIVGEVPYLCNGIQKVHSKLTLLVTHPVSRSAEVWKWECFIIRVRILPLFPSTAAQSRSSLTKRSLISPYKGVLEKLTLLFLVKDLNLY